MNRRKLKKLGLKFNPLLALIGLRITGHRITDFTNKKFTDSRFRITLHIGQITSPRVEENIAISMISRNLHRKQGLYSFFFLNLLTIYELNSYLLALFMYSYFRGQLPPSFSDYLSQNNTIHSYNAKSANKVHIKYERTNYRRFSVRYRGVVIWNSLPNSLKEIKSLQLFKRKLK